MSLVQLVGKIRGKKRLGEGEGEGEDVYRAPVVLDYIGWLLGSNTIRKINDIIYIRSFNCVCMVKSVTDNTVVWKYLRSESRLELDDPRWDRMNLQSMKKISLQSFTTMRHVLEWSGDDEIVFGSVQVSSLAEARRLTEAVEREVAEKEAAEKEAVAKGAAAKEGAEREAAEGEYSGKEETDSCKLRITKFPLID